MKYDKQRNHQIVPDKYEPNQQFLTFRNNPITENTGRSVYSQQFDYKSLQKYKKEEDDLQYHTASRRNMKNMRSQDKYRQLKEENGLYQKIDDNNNQSSHGVDQVSRNNQLKLKYGKLMKLIKKEEKMSESLSKDIMECKEEINENNDRILKNNSNIDQLNEIEKQNQKNCMQILKKEEGIRERELEFNSKIQYLNASISELKQMKKNQHCNLNNYPKMLNQGIHKLENYRHEIQKKIELQRAMIQEIKGHISEIDMLDIEIRYPEVL